MTLQWRRCLFIVALSTCASVIAVEISSQPFQHGKAFAEDEPHQASRSQTAPRIPALYSLETSLSRTVSASYTYSVSVPALTAEEWEIFAPKPVTLPGQRILRVATSPEADVVSDASSLRQPLFRALVPVLSPELRHRIVFTVAIDAQLFSRRLVGRETSASEAGVESLTDLERRLALRSTPQFDYSSKRVKTWMAGHELIRLREEGEVDYARRVFQVMARTLGYDYRGEQDRSASHVCTVLKSDCGGLSALFVAVLRSQGVPARTRAGRWATSVRLDQRMGSVRFFQEHIKAEFYAQGVGWVPVDLSSAVLHDTSDAKLRYFGSDAGDFITWHLDTDLVFDTLHFGRKTCTLLQRPSYWVVGVGSMAGATTSEDWQVR
jgi:transglutaminase-like putative cysteine protease